MQNAATLQTLCWSSTGAHKQQQNLTYQSYADPWPDPKVEQRRSTIYTTGVLLVAARPGGSTFWILPVVGVTDLERGPKKPDEAGDLSLSLYIYMYMYIYIQRGAFRKIVTTRNKKILSGSAFLNRLLPRPPST